MQQQESCTLPAISPNRAGNGIVLPSLSEVAQSTQADRATRPVVHRPTGIRPLHVPDTAYRVRESQIYQAGPRPVAPVASRRGEAPMIPAEGAAQQQTEVFESQSVAFENNEARGVGNGRSVFPYYGKARAATTARAQVVLVDSLRAAVSAGPTFPSREGGGEPARATDGPYKSSEAGPKDTAEHHVATSHATSSKSHKAEAKPRSLKRKPWQAQAFVPPSRTPTGVLNLIHHASPAGQAEPHRHSFAGSTSIFSSIDGVTQVRKEPRTTDRSNWPGYIRRETTGYGRSTVTYFCDHASHDGEKVRKFRYPHEVARHLKTHAS